MEATVPNHFVPALVSFALRFALGSEQLFARAGIELSAARAKGARFSVEEVERLVDALLETTRLPQLALLLGEGIDPESLGLFGQLVATSATPRQAITTFSEFKLLLHPCFDLRIEERDGVAGIRYASNDSTPIRDKAYYAETLLTALVALGRHFLGVTAPPLRATFRHAAPAYREEYTRILGITPEFGEAADALYYPAVFLDVPMLSSSSAYHEVLRMQAALELASSHAPALSQVRRAIRARIEEPELSLTDVARELAQSARTLQRRLSEAGMGFRELHDEVRYARARELLEMGTLNIEGVASALGYRDRSNFVRAFSRWSGESPSAYRQLRARR